MAGARVVGSKPVEVRTRDRDLADDRVDLETAFRRVVPFGRLDSPHKRLNTAVVFVATGEGLHRHPGHHLSRMPYVANVARTRVNRGGER